MEKSKADKKKNADGQTIARAYRPPWSLRPEAVDELVRLEKYRFTSIHITIFTFSLQIQNVHL